MLDGMSDSIQRSRIENLHSREVDRQSPTGLIFIYLLYVQFNILTVNVMKLLRWLFCGVCFVQQAALYTRQHWQILHSWWRLDGFACSVYNHVLYIYIYIHTRWVTSVKRSDLVVKPDGLAGQQISRLDLSWDKNWSKNQSDTKRKWLD